MLACCPCLRDYRARLSRFLSSKNDRNDNSFTTGGSMWKLMSFGRATAYTLPTNPMGRERGHTNLSLSWMSVNHAGSQPNSPPTEREQISNNATFTAHH